PGAQAVAGFKTIKTGTVSVLSGTLATWNTHSLSGVYTLRLTVTDRVDQQSVSQAQATITGLSAAGDFEAAGPDPSFAFREVFVFPNPAKGGAVPTIHIEVGVVDRVTVKIYNVAGQELLEDAIT